MLMLMLDLWAQAETPGVTHFGAYHRPPDGHFLTFPPRWTLTPKNMLPFHLKKQARSNCTIDVHHAQSLDQNQPHSHSFFFKVLDHTFLSYWPRKNHIWKVVFFWKVKLFLCWSLSHFHMLVCPVRPLTGVTSHLFTFVTCIRPCKCGFFNCPPKVKVCKTSVRWIYVNVDRPRYT